MVVASDNPDYDREWLARLLRRADIEDDVLLTNISELHMVAVEPLFAVLPDVVEAIRAEAIKATDRESRPYPANPRDRKGRGAIGEADDLLGQSLAGSRSIGGSTRGGVFGPACAFCAEIAEIMRSPRFASLVGEDRAALC